MARNYVKSKRCGKRKYRDRISALLALASTTQNRKARGKDETRAYHCPICKGWHLTSQPLRTRSMNDV